MRHVFGFDSKFKHIHFDMSDYLIHILGYNLNVSKKNRHTRGAVNIIGSIANAHFGTATQDQIDHINEKSQSLNRFTEEERKFSNVHSHILNVTLGDLPNVHQALNLLETATSMTEKIFNKLHDKITETNQEVVMLETLLHVHLALIVIFADHINLRIGFTLCWKTIFVLTL